MKPVSYVGGMWWLGCILLAILNGGCGVPSVCDRIPQVPTTAMDGFPCGCFDLADRSGFFVLPEHRDQELRLGKAIVVRPDHIIDFYQGDSLIRSTPPCIVQSIQQGERRLIRLLVNSRRESEAFIFYGQDSVEWYEPDVFDPTTELYVR
jgi:hypothetical protein